MTRYGAGASVPRRSVCPCLLAANARLSERADFRFARRRTSLSDTARAAWSAEGCMRSRTPVQSGVRLLLCRFLLTCPRAATGHLMTISALPQADGLYDPRYEHDACGVAMVARLDNQPDHGVITPRADRARQPRAPRRRGRRRPHRRRRGHPHPGPRRVLPRGRRLRAAARRPVRRRRLLPAARRRAAPQDRGAARAQRPHRGPGRSSAGATSRSTSTTSATPPTSRARTSASCSSARARASPTTRTRSSASST